MLARSSATSSLKSFPPKTPPASKSSTAEQTSISSTSPSSKPGLRMEAPSSPSPASLRAIPNPANAMSACTACRSTTAKTTGMHWQRQKVAAEHMRDRLREVSRWTLPRASTSWPLTAGGTTAATSHDTLASTTITKIREDRMEVAVAIGTDPATHLQRHSPCPP